MAAVLQEVDLGHHAREVEPGRLGVDRCVVALAVGAHLLADHPHVCAVDLAHRVGAVAAGGLDDAADLVAGGDVIVDLLEDLA